MIIGLKKAPLTINTGMLERPSAKLAALSCTPVIIFSADLMPKANSLYAFSVCSNEPSRVFKNV